MNYRALIAECEAEIRLGNTEAAAARLRDLPAARVPDNLRLPLAGLCRRCGLVSMGLKLLTPPNMPDREEWLRAVKPAEIAEYALLLQRIGSVNEALTILAKVDAALCPEAWLYRAYCHFNRWEYSLAIPLLEKYLETPLDAYKRLVGRVNLAAALVAAEDSRATVMIDGLIAECLAGGHVRLLANAHELRAQLALSATDLGKARSALAESLKILESSKTLDQLFAKKLAAVMTALENGDVSEMESFRAEALLRMDWESARDIDFFMLKLAFSEERLAHLIFGTPFPAYRARVQRAIGKRLQTETYIYGDTRGSVMDVAKATIDGKPCLTVGGKIHQMLEILLRDFYRPKTLAALFSELFPNEHFDIFSSTDRLHQILKRTRAWIAESGIPVEIVEIERYYTLKVTGRFGFLLTMDRDAVDWNVVHFRRLRSSVENDRVYSPKELRSKLGLGLTPFRRFATWALEEGVLERSGSGPATVYRLRTG